MKYGIDVSSWQGKIDWSKVKKAGIEFAILRAGFGWG
ncbi:MAG TPA: GH25 family lysozyme, partial [Candidatus Atribacteria bacterium]|nr:GH25 family lysozyme [Candidatus Atribacteria bacterium]